MTFDFDTPIPLRGSHCVKWDGMEPALGLDAPDAIPMWVADMDFRTAPAILDALRTEADRGMLGYFGSPDDVAQAVADWWRKRHGWAFDPSWVTFTTGVVSGLGAALHAFTEPGDGIIVFSPVYHAFYRKVRDMDRSIVESELILRDGRYEMDLDALATTMTGHEKMVILCSPHNPGGRLWSADELRALAEFCAAHDLLLVSDEIHMDLMFPGASHCPTATAAPECLDRLVVLSAASKAFNTAGGETGYAIVPDPSLRKRYVSAARLAGGVTNRFGLIMTRTAYHHGEDWLDAVRAYIADNFAIWMERIGTLPGISVMDMSSTYLTWIDFSKTGMPRDEITERLHRRARLGMSPGTQFGTGGETWNRFNIAMPRSLLVEAIERFEAAFDDLQ